MAGKTISKGFKTILKAGKMVSAAGKMICKPREMIPLGRETTFLGREMVFLGRETTLLGREIIPLGRKMTFLGKKMIFPAFPQAPPSRKTPYKLWFLANYAEFEAKAATGTRFSSRFLTAPRVNPNQATPPAVREWTMVARG